MNSIEERVQSGREFMRKLDQKNKQFLKSEYEHKKTEGVNSSEKLNIKSFFKCRTTPVKNLETSDFIADHAKAEKDTNTLYNDCELS
jgi:hypothetical protein